MKMKHIYAASFSALVIGLLMGSSFAQGEPQSKDKSSIGSPKKASLALKQLDEARTWKEWDGAIKDMEAVSKENQTVLRSYVDDQKHDGRKRFKIFKVLLDSASAEEKSNAIDAKYSSEKDMDFRVSLMQEMGREKSNIYNKKLQDTVKAEKEHSFVRISASLALAAHGDSSGKALALKSVKEASPYKDFAMQTLAVLKAGDVIPNLSGAMKSSSDYWVKNSCRLAILRIELASANNQAQLELLSTALTEDGYFEARQWAGRKLAEIGSKAAGQILAEVVKSNKSIDKNAALTGLNLGINDNKWEEEEVKEWLKK